MRSSASYPRPSRFVAYLALSSIVSAAVTIAYRAFIGNDAVALVLGALAIVLGILALVLRAREKRRAGFADFPSIERVEVKSLLAQIARWGAVLVIGSFAWLLFAVTVLGATNANMTFFYIWLAGFIIGSAMVFLPPAVRILGRIRMLFPNDDL